MTKKVSFVEFWKNYLISKAFENRNLRLLMQYLVIYSTRGI
jgi:hypothetical protein